MTSAQQPSSTANDLHYTFTDLGTPLGGTFAQIVGIGRHGTLYGTGNLPGDVAQHAFVFKDGAARDLGTFGGNDSIFLGDSSGLAESARLDPLGQDFCHFGTCQICTAMTVRDGKLVPLPALGGYSSTAFGNNDLGQVVGTAQTLTPDPDCLVDPSFGLNLQFLPVKWTFGKPKALALAPGDSIGHAYSINNLGQAVGATGICVSNEYAHALLWDGSRTIDLGNLGGSTGNQPASINDQGEVTGTSGLPGDLTSHAFLWRRRGKMQDLGTLSGDYSSYGNSINNRSQIAGQSCDVNFNCRAILWEKAAMIDLNTLLPPTSTLSLQSANVIDDEGRIAGYAFDSATNTLPAFSAQLEHGKCDAPPTLRNLRLSPGGHSSEIFHGMTRQSHHGAKW